MSSDLLTTTRTKLLDGARLAAEIKGEIAAEVAQLLREHLVVPCLAAVRVGDDPASAVYVRNKIRACEEVGIRSEHHAVASSATSDEIFELVKSLNRDEEIDGILVQLPLPGHISEGAVVDSIDPAKDVDGFHPTNVGKLVLGRPRFVPCTPAGVIEILDRYEVPIRGTRACIVGRSQIVGRPVAQLLLQRDATVTICHSRTVDLASVTREADILVVAIGQAGFIGREHIKPGAIVIDVGMNTVTDADAIPGLFGGESGKRLEILQRRGQTLVGDVNPAQADEVAGGRTPVPGGVGPLTVAMLMRNTVRAARLRRGLD